MGSRQRKWKEVLKRNANGQQSWETMVNVASHPGNANQWSVPSPVSMAEVQNTGSSKRCWRCDQRGPCTHCEGECKLVKPLSKADSFQRSTHAIQSSNPTTEYATKIQTQWVRHLHHYVYSSVLQGANTWNQPGWVDEEHTVCTHNGILLSYNKEQNSSIWWRTSDWVKNKSDPERQIGHVLHYVWELKFTNTTVAIKASPNPSQGSSFLRRLDPSIASFNYHE